MSNGNNPNTLSKPVVLLADDDLFIRTLLRKFLPDQCLFVEVSDGEAVLEHYKKAHPKIVFLDMHMPGQDGTQIVKDILIFDPRAYIIIISADGSRENVSASVISGAKGFMVKPLDGKRILQEYTKAIAA